MEAAALEFSMDQVSAVAAKSRGWLKFIGFLTVVGGVITALTVVGILVAWLPIWMGVLLFQAGNLADNLATTKDPARMVTLLDKLRVYFKIQGVLLLISIVFAAISLILSGGSMLAILQSLNP